MRKKRKKGFAELFYNRLERMHKKPDKILYDNSVREALQTLEPAGDTQSRQKEYVMKKLSLCGMVVVCGLAISVILWIKEGAQTKIVDNRIARNAYGDGEKEISLVAKDTFGSYEVDLSVEERLYQEQELNALLENFLPILEKTMLGENVSLDEVSYNLNLLDSIEGFPFTVEWQTDGDYIDIDGRLVHNTLDAPKLVELTAVISCEEFEVRRIMNCVIFSRAVQPSRAELLAQMVEDIQHGTRNEEFMTLPSEMDTDTIRWSYQRSNTGILVFLAMPLLVFVIYIGKDRDLQKQVAHRNEQLRLDYPEIVSALALLIGAGMAVPNAWQRVAKDYRVRRQETGRVRFAYEEMLLTIYEMESGVAQTNAYERFGRRCRVQSYNRLAAMLSQNVRKGAANLAILLREEAANAFEERKHMARRLGEKAGTKLLVPMMMLLGMIMVIIMVPAFQSYF